MQTATSAPLVRRVRAAQATLDHFRDRPFAWGTVDCAKMAAFHLRQLGHAPKLAKAGTYKTAIGARGALRRLGCESLEAVLDAHGLQRITPAAALAGDIVMGEGEPPFGALGIVLSNGRLCGFHEDLAGASVIQPVGDLIAWRVEVKS